LSQITSGALQYPCSSCFRLEETMQAMLQPLHSSIHSPIHPFIHRFEYFCTQGKIGWIRHCAKDKPNYYCITVAATLFAGSCSLVRNNASILALLSLALAVLRRVIRVLTNLRFCDKHSIYVDCSAMQETYICNSILCTHNIMAECDVFCDIGTLLGARNAGNVLRPVALLPLR
jgi:hypothetical protein